jgi:tetratricopeptide (TPR) repeat protein
MEVLLRADKLLKQHKLVEAVAEYTSTINKLQVSGPKQVLSSAYNNRGQCHYLQVDFYKAIDDYTDSLKYDPANCTALYNRAQVKYRLNFFSEAREDILKALEISPDFVDAKSCLEAIDNAVSNKTSS